MINIWLNRKKKHFFNFSVLINYIICYGLFDLNIAVFFFFFAIFVDFYFYSTIYLFIDLFIEEPVMMCKWVFFICLSSAIEYFRLLYGKIFWFSVKPTNFVIKFEFSLKLDDKQCKCKSFFFLLFQLFVCRGVDGGVI